jgi:hypothetical protein
MTPHYWLSFVAQHSLIGKEVSVPEESDQSELGAEIEILDEEGIRSESEDCYPGIAVVKDGFIPIGSCSLGSGDPYFINIQDGTDGPLYRIYHDAVTEDGYDRDEAVVIVLSNFSKILNYLA